MLYIKRKRILLVIIMGVVALLLRIFGNMYLASLESSSAMAQIQPGENSVLERSFLQSNLSMIVVGLPYLLCFIAICLLLDIKNIERAEKRIKTDKGTNETKNKD